MEEKGGKSLSILSKNADTEIDIEKVFTKSEGVLFEKPTGPWSVLDLGVCENQPLIKNKEACENGGFTWTPQGQRAETILEFGKRVANGLAASGVWEPELEGLEGEGYTTTTEAPGSPFIESYNLKVSGWKEVSKLKIKLREVE